MIIQCQQLNLLFQLASANCASSRLSFAAQWFNYCIKTNSVGITLNVIDTAWYVVIRPAFGVLIAELNLLSNSTM